MKIIKNWKANLKSYSAVSLASLVAIPLVWEQLPPEVVALIPDQYREPIIALIALIGFIGRFISQDKEPAK